VPITTVINPDSRVLFTISIGYNQTGENFENAVNEIVSNENITHVTLLLADTLQRHVLMARNFLNEDDALKEASLLSKKWQDENKESIEKLCLSKKDVVVCTWDDFKNLESFQIAHEKVASLYKSDKTFKGDYVNNMAGKRAQQIKKQQPQFGNKKAILLKIVDYLIEECALQYFLCESEKYVFHYESYMGRRNAPMQYIHTYLNNESRMLEAPILIKTEEKQFASQLPYQKSDSNFFNEKSNLPKNGKYVKFNSDVDISLAFEASLEALSVIMKEGSDCGMKFSLIQELDLLCKKYGIQSEIELGYTNAKNG